MKKLITLPLFCILLAITSVPAKKIRFAVDMYGQVISPNGIHITGDFQAIAGFPGGDWQANTTLLANEPGTDVYSIILDLPAFALYKYKFVNGDQSYDVEFVPDQSRVGYNFDDNRWLWVDSLADDTTDIGALLFSGNAPSGLTLIRLLVDMQEQSPVSADGIHVAGNFQGWNPATTRLYSFGSQVYEIINYVTTGNYEFKYYNGNVSGATEIIPSTCATNTNRSITVTNDTVLPVVCFSSCNACVTGIEENQLLKKLKLYPNPSHNFSILEFEPGFQWQSILLTDPTGRLVRTFEKTGSDELLIETGDMEKGIYFLNILDEENNQFTTRLVIE